MDVGSLVERIRIEQNIIGHVREALTLALEAPIKRPTGAQWLERVTFLARSFSRHLQRLFEIEEEQDYEDDSMDATQASQSQPKRKSKRSAKSKAAADDSMDLDEDDSQPTQTQTKRKGRRG